MQNRRRELISELMAARSSTVICYISGDRQSISTRVAHDIIPVIYEHLRSMKAPERIDLFLYTKGGDVLTTLRLVHLIYEYTQMFGVLIPYKAYSAGTLIGLGASELVMTKMGELSPVDPNVTSIFNPEDPQNPAVKLPISVEDVYSFFSIAKDMLGIQSEEALANVFSHLVDTVNPLAIGNIQRTHSLIRVVAKKLLRMHMQDEARMDSIVDSLTEQLFSHSYLISRSEAKTDVHLPVTDCDDQLENIMWELYQVYMEDFQLNRPFVPELQADRDGRFSACCGVIESLHRTDEYVFDGIVQPADPNTDNVSILEQGWRQR